MTTTDASTRPTVADRRRDPRHPTRAVGPFAGGWEKWDDVVDSVLGPVGAAMVERSAIADDQQHLDVAAGTGEPGLTIARLARHGRVTLTDIAPEMLAAAQRARSTAQRSPTSPLASAAPTTYRSGTTASTASVAASA